MAAPSVGALVSPVAAPVVAPPAPATVPWVLAGLSAVVEPGEVSVVEEVSVLVGPSAAVVVPAAALVVVEVGGTVAVPAVSVSVELAVVLVSVVIDDEAAALDELGAERLPIALASVPRPPCRKVTSLGVVMTMPI